MIRGIFHRSSLLNPVPQRQHFTSFDGVHPQPFGQGRRGLRGLREQTGQEVPATTISESQKGQFMPLKERRSSGCRYTGAHDGGYRHCVLPICRAEGAVKLRDEGTIFVLDRNVGEETSRRSLCLKTGKFVPRIFDDLFYIRGFQIEVFNTQYEDPLVSQRNQVIFREKHDGDEARQNCRSNQDDEQEKVRLFYPVGRRLNGLSGLQIGLEGTSELITCDFCHGMKRLRFSESS